MIEKSGKHKETLELGRNISYQAEDTVTMMLTVELNLW